LASTVPRERTKALVVAIDDLDVVKQNAEFTGSGEVESISGNTSLYFYYN
jgi:hypothetical protein